MHQRTVKRLLRWLIGTTLVCGVALAAAPQIGQNPGTRPSADAFDELFQRLDFGDLSALDTSAQQRIVARLEKLLPPGDAHRRRVLDSAHCELDYVNKPKQGFSYADTKLADALQAGDSAAAIRFYYCRGGYQEIIASARDALADFERGIELARKFDEPALLADGLSARGDIYSLLGIYGKALADILEARRMFVKLNLPEAASQSLPSIGVAYRRLGYLDKAAEYLNQSIEHEKRIGDQESLSVSLLQLGYTQDEGGHYTEALETLRRALEVSRLSNDRQGIGATNLAIASVLNDLRRHNEAMQTLNAAEKDFTAVSDVTDLGMLSYERGRALAGLGQTVKALDAFKHAESVFVSSSNQRYQEMLYKAMSATLESAGRAGPALTAYKRFLSAHDEVEHQRANQQAQMLREQFDTDRSNLENARLRAEKKLKDRQVDTLQRVRRWQQIAMGLLAILIGALIILAIRQLARLRRWQRMASIDSLTGIANRRSIEHFLGSAMRHARGRHEALSLLAIDIDRFKRINDDYGHATGDRVLVRITRACQAALRDGDLLGRIGGEEFLAVLPGSTLNQALDIAERLRRRVEQLTASDNSLDASATISIGVAQMLPSDTGIEDIERRADEALYRAKSSGRNRVDTAIDPNVSQERGAFAGAAAATGRADPPASR